MEKKKIFELTYEINQNSDLSELESYRLAEKLEPFFDDMLNEELSGIKSGLDNLEIAIKELVANADA